MIASTERRSNTDISHRGSIGKIQIQTIAEYMCRIVNKLFTSKKVSKIQGTQTMLIN